jgi:hypothetical protein
MPARAQDAYGDVFWQYRASVGVDYSSGHYGSATPTDIVYSYASLRAAKGPWTIKLVVPWIALWGPAVLLEGASGSVASGVSRKTSGMGDMSLAATYAVQKFADKGLFIDFTARLKLPTASFNKGLGTGQTDAAVQIDLAQTIGKFMPFVTFGYKANGRPHGYRVRDVVYGTAGLQYNVNDRISAGALFDYRQAAIRTAEDPRELTPYVNVKIGTKWMLNAYGVVGFSRNSPSAGGGAVLSYRW